MTVTQADQKALGILSGLAFALAWTFLVMYIGSTTISYHQNVFQNPLLVWIDLGPVPLFIMSGRYYFTKSNWHDAKKQQEFTALKGMIAAFFIWIIVIIFLQLQQINDENYIYPTIAGYLLMIVLTIAFQGKIRLSESNKS